jgi:hypothetical protein
MKSVEQKRLRRRKATSSSWADRTGLTPRSFYTPVPVQISSLFVPFEQLLSRTRLPLSAVLGLSMSDDKKAAKEAAKAEKEAAKKAEKLRQEQEKAAAKEAERLRKEEEQRIRDGAKYIPALMDGTVIECAASHV